MTIARDKTDSIKWLSAAIGFASIAGGAAIIGWLSGRTLFGPDGRFGIWAGDIWGPACSQRFADPYSFSHIGHGIVFYFLLWLFARRLPVRIRFLIATAVEAGWELLENSPIIMSRYREATIAIGYAGDSLLNSTSDILMMALGFFLAWRLPAWASVLLLVVMEIGCALWVRDNLALNVLMLLSPIQAIKSWQMGGAP